MESWRNPNHFSQLLQSRRARWIPKNPIFNWITLLSATLSSLFSPAQRHIPIPSFLQLFLPLFFPLLEVGSPEGLFVFFGGSSWHSAPGIFPCAPCSNNHTSTPSWNKAGLHLGEGYDNQGEIRDHIWNWEKLVNFHEKSMRSWNDFFFFFSPVVEENWYQSQQARSLPQSVEISTSITCFWPLAGRQKKQRSNTREWHSTHTEFLFHTRKPEGRNPN